jgi:hypothetical protein
MSDLVRIELREREANRPEAIRGRARAKGEGEVTVQQSIIIGAPIVGASIIGSRLVAPYQMASGPALIWRLNTITGEVRECLRELDERSPRAVSDCK